MYRPPAFVVDKVSAVHDAMRGRVFATIAAARASGVEFAYAPVLIDADDGGLGGVRFHLARGNPLAKILDGARTHLSMIVADAYVSPDWYRSTAMVPTWNYIAAEGEGVARRLSRAKLHDLLAELSAQEEAKLAPKTPWTLDKLPSARFETLLNAIVGYSVSFERLEGKFKLSQDKSADDFEGVIAGLEGRWQADSTAVAEAMRKSKS